ncbi:LysR substrate-binding domain-containing protein [Streptomyces hirsutus]|uniref:LysR substrate-binding domain-containing protein n=1 Tax=Streptomyces hirsutus TaxID=35620 RepID=UPI0036A21899
MDVAFLSLPEHKPAGIGARELATVPLVLVVSAAHPLAQRGEVALADLAGGALRGLPAGLRQPRGGRPGVRGGRRTPGGTGSARHRHGAALVRHGLGIAFLPAFAVARTPGLHVLDVDGTMLRCSMHLGTSSTRRPSSALRALLDLVDLHVIVL